MNKAEIKDYPIVTDYKSDELTALEKHVDPFHPMTPVVPFSNGTEAMIFGERNCVNCLKRSFILHGDSAYHCPLQMAIDDGFIIGSIPLWAAKRIGVKEYRPLTLSVTLSECREKDDGNNELPF